MTLGYFYLSLKCWYSQLLFMSIVLVVEIPLSYENCCKCAYYDYC